MNPIEFARNLFLLRKEHNMTIEDLSVALEVTPELICEWECAKTSPTLDQMNRLAKVYGIPLAEVIRTPKPRTEPEPVPTPVDVVPEPEPVEESPVPEQEEEPVPPKKKPAVWEIIVIIVLILIIGAGIVFLVRPEWFPLKNLLGAWSLLQPHLLR